MQSFTFTALLGIPLGGFKLRILDCHDLWSDFPNRYAHRLPTTLRSHNPEETSFSSLDCSAFARHYLRNHFVLYS